MQAWIRRTLIASIAAGAAAVLMIGIAWYEPAPGPDAPDVLVSVDASAWNEVGLNAFTYIRALREAGLDPVTIDYRDVADVADVDGLFDGIQGLVITGGGDVGARHYGGDADVTRGVIPRRDTFELSLLDAAHEKSMPILGLCRGAQLLNVYRGGTLGDFRDDEERYARHRRPGPGHAVYLRPGSRLAGIYGADRLDRVVSWHGQHVARPGRAVDIVASSPDGTPEAFEIGGEHSAWMTGVQWHAEFPVWDEGQQALFDAFATAVAGHAPATADPHAGGTTAH